MKNFLYIRFVLAAAGLWLWLLATAVAQVLPTPPTPEAHKGWIVRELPQQVPGRMPVQKMSRSESRMPQARLEAMGRNPRTGEVVSYFDQATGLTYDFEHGLIYDQITGKIYQFFRKDDEPKPLPKHLDGSQSQLLKPGSKL